MGPAIILIDDRCKTRLEPQAYADSMKGLMEDVEHMMGVWAVHVSAEREDAIPHEMTFLVSLVATVIAEISTDGHMAQNMEVFTNSLKKSIENYTKRMSN